MKNIIWKKFEYIMNSKDMESDDDDEEWKPKKKKGFNLKLFAGPNGLVPVNDQNTFNFWIANTNFVVTRYHFKQIENIPGVESLHAITQYRFRVGIGVAFNENTIKDNIELKLCDRLPKHIIDLANYLKKKGGDWAVYREDKNIEVAELDENRDAIVSHLNW